jgi:hypothetical protein
MTVAWLKLDAVLISCFIAVSRDSRPPCLINSPVTMGEKIEMRIPKKTFDKYRAVI